MTGWRRRLAALRAEAHPGADCAGSADRRERVIDGAPIGTNGAIGSGAEHEAGASLAAALLRFAEEAFAALSEREPDPIEEAERAAVFGSGEGGGRHGVAVGEENFGGKASHHERCGTYDG